jgi:hypothetical protein
MGQRNLVMFLDDIAPPILASFHDADHRVRYFACESMYNVAKVELRISCSLIWNLMPRIHPGG